METIPTVSLFVGIPLTMLLASAVKMVDNGSTKTLHKYTLLVETFIGFHA